MRRFLQISGGVVGLVLVALTSLMVACAHKLPDSRTGPEAGELAARIEAAVDVDAWRDTGAVAFVFAGKNRHLWDRARELHRFESGDLVVVYDLKTRQGKAWRKDTLLEGDDLTKALDTAWAMWCNDTFWLNPLAKLRDDGVELSVVDLKDGAKGLMVHYGQGGVTPGDRYLWLPGEDGRPSAWRMWVSIIPIPGVETSWDGWTRLSTGAWVSTRHKFGPLPLEVTELEAARTMAELRPGDDPFGTILAVKAPVTME